MSTPTREATRRERLIAAGTCYVCRRAPARPDATTCDTCSKRGVRVMREVRRDRLAAGLCQLCGEQPPEPGRKGCRACLDVAKAKTRARRSEARAQ